MKKLILTSLISMMCSVSFADQPESVQQSVITLMSPSYTFQIIVSECILSGHCSNAKEFLMAAKEEASLCLVEGCDVSNYPVLLEAIDLLKRSDESVGLTDEDLLMEIVSVEEKE